MTNDKQRERLVELLDEFVAKSNNTTTSALADYILADGWMRPPCKVGDKVYFVFEGDVLGDEITLIEVTESAMYLSTCSERYMLINGYLYSEMLDEKAYFTKEEAEAKLKEGVQG